MSDTTMFDTHRHVKELATHGLSEACAESIVKVIQDGYSHNVATKTDLALLESRLIKWMVGTTATTILAFIGIIAAFMK